MTATFLGNPPPESDEWHAIRAQGIGGSEIAAIVGLSPFESAFSLWHRKTGAIGPQDENESMEWGHRLEDAVCAKFADEHPDLDVAVSDGMYVHRHRSWQRANVDRMLTGADGPSLLEAKTADGHSAHEWGPTGTDQIPPYYRCQTLWYLDVLGLDQAWLAVLIGGNDYREYQIAYAPDEAQWLRHQGHAFWKSTRTGARPPLDASDATYQAVRELHPDIDDVIADLDPALWDAWVDTKAAAKAAAAAHQHAKTAITDAMGSARYGAVLDTKVVRRQARGTSAPFVVEIPQPKDQENSA